MEVRDQFVGKSDKANKYSQWFLAPANKKKQQNIIHILMIFFLHWP